MCAHTCHFGQGYGFLRCFSPSTALPPAHSSPIVVRIIRDALLLRSPLRLADRLGAAAAYGGAADTVPPERAVAGGRFARRASALTMSSVIQGRRQLSSKAITNGSFGESRLLRK